MEISSLGNDQFHTEAIESSIPRVPPTTEPVCLELMLLNNPGGSAVKNPSANPRDAGDSGSILGLGKSPGVGNGNPSQYPCLENSRDKGAWQATICRVTKSRIPLSDYAHIHTYV